MYPTILTQDQLGPHIFNTWLNINNHIGKLRALGIQVWMPDFIDFDCNLIDKFQALPVVTLEGGTNNELQTGTDTAVTVATTDDTTNQTTTHGETVQTTDNGQNLYCAGDLTMVPTPNYINPPISLPF